MRQIKPRIPANEVAIPTTQVELKRITEFAPILTQDITDEKLWILGDTDGLLHNPSISQMKQFISSFVEPSDGSGGTILDGIGFVNMDGKLVSYIPKISLETQVNGVLPVENGGVGVSNPSLVEGNNISITGTWPNQIINNSMNGNGFIKMNGLTPVYVVKMTLTGGQDVTGILPIVNGGTGSTTANLNGSVNIDVTGTFPNNTIAFKGILPINKGGNGTDTPGLVQGNNVTITGSWPNQMINAAGAGLNGTGYVKQAGLTTSYVSQVSLPTEVTGILSKANGGTGTATPGAVQGANIAISGTWPNQTIAAQLISTIGTTLDGGGFVVTTGQKGYIRIPYNAVITEWAIIAKEIGSVQFDVWKRNASKPISSNSITGTAKPVLNNSDFAASTVLTGWNTSLQAGDVVGWNLDSVTGITWVMIQITISKI